VLQRALRGELIVPDWVGFTEEVVRIVEAVREDCRGLGKNAHFNKELANADCANLGLAIMTGTVFTLSHC